MFEKKLSDDRLSGPDSLEAGDEFTLSVRTLANFEFAFFLDFFVGLLFVDVDVVLVVVVFVPLLPVLFFCSLLERLLDGLLELEVSLSGLSSAPSDGS